MKIAKTKWQHLATWDHNKPSDYNTVTIWAICKPEDKVVGHAGMYSKHEKVSLKCSVVNDQMLKPQTSSTNELHYIATVCGITIQLRVACWLQDMYKCFSFKRSQLVTCSTH